MNIKKISKCRCCGSKILKLFLDFEKMCLTTEFPNSKAGHQYKIPMKLVICEKCKLFQLLHNWTPFFGLERLIYKVLMGIGLYF